MNMASGLLEQIVAGAAPSLVSLTTDQYQRLTELGILPEGSPVELIDGLLVYKDRGDARSSSPMNQGPIHALTVSQLMRTVSRLVDSEDTLVWCQLPVSLSPNHEPEPDVSILEGPASRYRDRLPEAKNTLATMEVAYTSRGFDRSTKQRVYAEAGIPLFVIIDLVDCRIEVYTEPDCDNGHYHICEVHSPGDEVSVELRNGVRLKFDVDQILPTD